MQPYVVKDGDYLLSLAHQFGFDADTVWNDPKNADLQKLRPDPNILLPGDILYIPDQDPPAAAPAQSLTPGATNSFVSSAPTVTLTHKFVGASDSDYANQAYTVTELDQLTGLTTDGSGVATFQAPVTLTTATVVFTGTGESWALGIGKMDPIDTLIGVFKRLQNLGYIDDDVQFIMDSPLDNVGLLRTALLALKSAQGVDSAPPSAPPSAPSSTPPSSPAPASTPPSSPAPASTPPSSPAPASTPPASASGPASQPPASSPAGSGPASSGPASSPPNSSPPSSGPSSVPPSGPQGPTNDGSGVADDGTIDADTTALLKQVHGC
jgi:hypothetical protein